MESFKCVVSPRKRSGASRRLSTSLTRCCLSVAGSRDRAHETQLPWAEVKKEMTQEKGLDSTIADEIGQYVMLKGAGVEGGHRRSPTPHSQPDHTHRQGHKNCWNDFCRILPSRRIRVRRKVYRI